MAWSPGDIGLTVATGGAYGAYKLGKDAMSGETINPYAPNPGAFEYKGSPQEYFQQLGRNPINSGKYLGNQAQSNPYQSREALASQIEAQRAFARDPRNSVAQQQLRQGQDAAMQQALALARAGQGAGGQAAALQQAQFSNANSNQQMNAAAATLRAQESTAAQQQLNEMTLQQRALDLQHLGLDSQTAMQRAQMELQGRLGFQMMGQNAARAEMQGQMGYEQLKSGNIMGAQGANAEADAMRDAALLNLVGTAGAAGITKSDPRSKEDVYTLSDKSSKMQIEALTAERDSYKSALDDITSRGRTLARVGRAAKQLYGGPPAVAEAWAEALDTPAERERMASKAARVVSGPMPTLRKVAPAVAQQATEPAPAPAPVEGPQAAAPAVVTPAMVYSDPMTKQERQELDSLRLALDMAKTPEQTLNAANPSVPTARFSPTQEMAKTEPVSFRYKPEFQGQYGADRKTGVMANGPGGLRDNRMTQHAVKRAPDGMDYVDTGELTMSNTATLADVSKQLEALKAMVGQNDMVPYPWQTRAQGAM